MYTVGMTGGIGSGKTTVENLFRHFGIDVVDADRISFGLVAPGMPSYEKIIARFGRAVCFEDGKINRRILRQIIFKDPAVRIWLEEMLHPLVRQQLIKDLMATKSPYVIVSIPLMVEHNLQHMVNRVLVIDCPEQEQIRRTMQRDNITEKQVKLIMETQCTRKERLAAAHDVIKNYEEMDVLQPMVTALHKKYLDLAAEHKKSSGK